MNVQDIRRRLRGALGTALLWGTAWSAVTFAVGAALRIVGALPDGTGWREVFSLGVRAGIIGFAAGAAFSAAIGFLYRGRKLSEINWARFGIGGGIATGVFVPLFLQLMNLVSGDGLVAWRLVLDDALWTGLLGGAIASGSLRLAQRAQRALPGTAQKRLDG